MLHKVLNIAKLKNTYRPGKEFLEDNKGISSDFIAFWIRQLLFKGFELNSIQVN